MSKPFNVTTRVNDKTTDFQVPIDDPFVRQTVHIEWRLISWLPWPRVRHKVEVIVDADQEVIRAVFRAIHELGEKRPGVTDPDIIRGVERLTGEKYEPFTDQWRSHP